MQNNQSSITPTEIKRLRRSMGLTQIEFLKLFHRVGSTTVSRWENGKSTPDPMVVHQMLMLQKQQENEDD